MREKVDRAELIQLRPYATPSQEVIVDAFLEHPDASSLKVGEILGRSGSSVRKTLSSLRRRATRKGFNPNPALNFPVSEGLFLKGQSICTDGEGNIKLVWHKTDAEREAAFDTFIEAASHLLEPFRGAGIAEEVPLFDGHDPNLLCVYPLGDPHVGMFSWHEETGEDFDLNIVEDHLVEAVDQLVTVAPMSKDALIVNVGDYFHADDQSNRTRRSGNELDVDSRWGKVLRVGLRILRRLVEMALQKHERVFLVNIPGNHDPHSSYFLSLLMEALYEGCDRVIVDTSPNPFHWHRFGNNLIGMTHGDGIKKEALLGVMVADRPRDVGETEHRLWLTGHIHHDSTREFPGCIVESVRTLASKDAWHHKSGYRSGQDLKCIVLDKEYGEINRHKVGIKKVIAGLQRRKGR